MFPLPTCHTRYVNTALIAHHSTPFLPTTPLANTPCTSRQLRLFTSQLCSLFRYIKHIRMAWHGMARHGMACINQPHHHPPVLSSTQPASQPASLPSNRPSIHAYSLPPAHCNTPSPLPSTLQSHSPYLALPLQSPLQPVSARPPIVPFFYHAAVLHPSVRPSIRPLIRLSVYPSIHPVIHYRNSYQS